MKTPNLFKAPIFESEKEEKMYETAVLYRLLWMGTILIIASEGIKAFSGEISKNTLFVFFTLLVLLLASISLIKQGKIKIFSFLVLVMSTFVTIALILPTGIIYSPYKTGLIFLVFISGIIFGKKGTLAYISILATILLVLFKLEELQLIGQNDPTAWMADWLISSTILGVTGYAMVQAYDRTKQALAKANEELNKRRKIEERLRLFEQAVEQSPVSIIIADTDAHIYFANQKFYKLTGYTPEEAIGKNPRILQSGEHTRSFYNTLWETLSNGKTWKGEFRNKKKNGDFYWEKASISPMLGKDGQITHYVAVKEDITREKEHKETLVTANLQLAVQMKEIQVLQKQLEKKALHDSLTGLYNRHYMNEVIELEFEKAKREKTPLSIIMVDLDNLKIINDIGGHETGDQALRTIATQLRNNIRKDDIACRYGGDEFAIILPGTNVENALTRALQIQKRVQELTPLYRAKQMLRITFTAGIATYPIHGNTSESILKNADIALYKAKLKGRNCVELFSVE